MARKGCRKNNNFHKANEHRTVHAEPASAQLITNFKDEIEIGTTMQNTVKATVEKKVLNGETEISYSDRNSPGLIIGGGVLSLLIGALLNIAFNSKGWSWFGYAIFVVLSFLALRFFLQSIVNLFILLKWLPSNKIFVNPNGIRTSNNTIPFSEIDSIGTQQNPNSLCFVFVETNGKRVAITGLTDKAQATKVQSMIVETANEHGRNYT